MDNLTPRHSYQSTPVVRTTVGRFVVEGTIGRGGMGEVLRCIDPTNDKVVAIKVLDADAYLDQDLLKRFHREAQSALSLDHVNIARFYGMENDAENRPIIVMEYIPGEPLDKWLKCNAEAPFSQIVDFAIQTARGLENAFRRSIIHRDIKPSNLIVTPDQVVKIIDFGLAKSMWDTSGLTGTGMVVGTPRYISPEQGMGRNVDHRSDIYSLGATLYELLTHQSPFDGDSPLAIMMKHINTPLVPPYLVNPKVPGDVNEIVIRMMAKDPGQRYQDYEPLIRELEAAKIHRLAKERRLSGMDSVSAGHASTVIVPGGERTPPPETIVQSRPSSYLSEGLVNVSYTQPEERPRSNVSKILLSISGVLIIGFAIAALMAPKEVEGKRQPSWFSKRVASAFKKPEAKEAGTTPEAIAKDDAEKVQSTASRMEAVVSKILEQRAADPNKAVTMRSLRASGAMSEEETQDAWGNDFFLKLSGDGSGSLYSKGRDGEENTPDDFRYALNGSSQTVPPALKAEEIRVEDTKNTKVPD